MNLLLVEDERDICHAMAERLRDIRAEYADTIDYCYSAHEAIDMIRRKHIDCLITDIRLGNESGLDLIEQAQGIQASLKSIVITAYDEFEYAQRAVRLGCGDFLLKPFTRQALKEALERVLPEDAYTGHDNGTVPIEWVRKYIYEHLSEEIDMATLSEKLHMSYAYFSRRFKEAVGMTFSSFLNDIRLTEAKRFLAAGWSVGETAEKVGYNNIYGFTRAFKHKFNMSPTAWVKIDKRQKHSQKG